eukprot:TRINITY_DN9957_c0_g1_i1.p1 TRINITY_DN9957_c0_g1~~TRINITY_DN9957_c0_g1_i1.p1  ORF type:complete len:247 (-),score=52.36 TRINITY_DN9957_c0_g1_i1:35-685(-)
MKEMITRDKNHPSVVMWSLANEPASNLDVADPYFHELTSFTREFDPTHRPITIVQSVSSDGQSCAEYTDVICVNRYYGWYSDTGSLPLIQLQLRNDLNNWNSKYNKPILVSEYGADTVPGMHNDPPAIFSEEFQRDFMSQYHAVFDELRQKFLVGELIWCFADFETAPSVRRVDSKNFKGVLTRNREPKAAAFLLKSRYGLLDKKKMPMKIPVDIL